MRTSIKAIAPIALAVLLALLPAPEGLAPHAWYFTAIFAGVVLALVLEPIPGALIGLVGVTAVALLSPWVLYRARAARAARLQPGQRLAVLGALRLRQRHGLADLRRLHVRPRLRPLRPRPAHRAAAGASGWGGGR